MQFSLCFWVLFLVYLVLGLWQADWKNLKQGGGNLLICLLLLLLGWKVFGAPIHD